MTYPIDVIVPAYNAAAFLREALESVAAQTYRVNEVIVVDDGSTDDTAQLARSLGATVISQPNAGIAAARNAAIRSSKSTYLALLDADDRWHPERLEMQWRVRSARPDVAIFATDYAFWQGGDGPAVSALSGHSLFDPERHDRVLPDAFVVTRERMLEALAQRNFVLPSSMLLHRRLFDESGIFYRTRERLVESDNAFIGEDYEWLLRALRVSDVAFVDRVLVDYRQLDSSISARRGRIRYGDIELGRLIASSPGAYIAGASAAFARNRPRMLRDSALAHARAGELDFTASRLRELATCTRRPERTIARIAAFALDFALVRRLIRPIVTLRRPRFR